MEVPNYIREFCVRELLLTSPSSVRGDLQNESGGKESVLHWCPPTTGNFKLNIDVACSPSNKVGLGTVIYNSNGSHQLSSPTGWSQ